ARDIGVEVVDVNVGEPFDPASFDIVLMGGGQDREQRRIADDLAERGPGIKRAVEDGLPVLAVCGGFQMFGHRYVDQAGGVIPGIGVFDLETRHPGPRADRCIGDVVLSTDGGDVVGFENHGGRTYLAAGQRPFGLVRRGYGNNADDGGEGARYKNAIGTYLHGSLLPKNPALADELILAALRRRYGAETALPPLDDAAEESAHGAARAVAEHRARDAAKHAP
ncbi:MAG: type 1 glutamine amidotransferase, partial [Tepidiformaceae bacterium]